MKGKTKLFTENQQEEKKKNEAGRTGGGGGEPEKFRREARRQNFGAQGLYDVANRKIHG